jgi:hypothetical protein
MLHADKSFEMAGKWQRAETGLLRVDKSTEKADYELRMAYFMKKEA